MHDHFVLHPDFSNKIHIATLNLSIVLVEPIKEFKWIMLVPQIPNIKNMLDLNEIQKQALWKEIDMVAIILKQFFQPDQINIAMLGNVTPQLHVHIIARFQDDTAWPRPTFGCETTKINPEEVLRTFKNVIEEIRKT